MFNYIRLTFTLNLLFIFSTKCIAQSYTYDVNGNLLKDPNKQIFFIHYNHLNLADTISFDDDRRIIYGYSASGHKLSERVIDANGRVIRKSDYAGEFLYDNDTLRQVRDENGRVVPILAGNNAAPWEYQYEQKDQVGNVRALITSKLNVDDNKGTFETANAGNEQNRFQRYDDVRKINSTLFDHTNSGTTRFSERLNGSDNEKYGLAKSLSVMPGDVINLEVFAKYVDPDASNWTAALNTLVSQIAAGTAAAGTVIDGTGYSTSGSIAFPFEGLSGSSGSRGAGPKAYLNWLVFDRNYVFKNGGYVKMSFTAKENGTGVPHERLSKQLTVQEAGFVYVYLSNEENTPVDVFFDDFNVQLVKAPVVHQTDYDPYGLAFNEISRENVGPNKFLYNGKELQQDFDLNWYDYGARMYDAALGRWHVADPKGDKYSNWSPYNYVLNNPVIHTDPDGKDPIIIITDIPVGTALLEAYNPIPPSNTPVYVRVPTYKVIILDTNSPFYREEGEVTRDALYVVSIVNGLATVRDVSFEPDVDHVQYEGEYVASYPDGNNTPAYVLTQNGSRTISSMPRNFYPGDPSTTATDIVLRVGGMYHNENDDTPGIPPIARVATSAGQFGIVNKGNSWSNPSDKETQRVIEAARSRPGKVAISVTKRRPEGRKKVYQVPYDGTYPDTWPDRYPGVIPQGY